MDSEVSVKSKENLVKKTCKELGITQKELANFFEVSAQTVSNWSRDFDRGKLEKTTIVALEGLLYKQKLQNIKENLLI